MSKTLKKCLSLLLAITIIICSCINIFAFEAYVDTPIPVVVIFGDSKTIVDKDGNLAFSTSKIGNMVNTKMNPCSMLF